MITEQKKERTFSFYLLLLVLALVALVVISITAIDYRMAEESLRTNEDLLKEQTEKDIVTQMRLMDSGLMLYDDTLNRQLEQGFVLFLEAYETSDRNPLKMNLSSVKQRIDVQIVKKLESHAASESLQKPGDPVPADATMDLYIVNESGIIEFATDTREIGVDFHEVPYFFAYLNDVRQSSGFFPDRVVRTRSSGEFRKYAYMPTPDHRYVLELGLRGRFFEQQRARLWNTMRFNETLISNPYVEQIRFYDSNGYCIEPAGLAPDNQTMEHIAIVGATRNSTEYSDPVRGTRIKYLFIDLKSDRYGSDMSTIVEITYDTALRQAALNQLLLWHVVVAVITLLIATSGAVLISRYLTRPIEGIVDDIDRIAQGALDHTLSSARGREFTALETSINLMVTKMKQTIRKYQESEARLKTSEERYRAVVESQTDFIIRFRPDGTTLFANEAFLRDINRSSDNVVGKRVAMNIHPDDLEGIRQGYASLTPAHPNGIFEYRVIDKDGRVRWYQWHTLGIFDTSGAATEYQSVGRDISEQRAAEEALRASEEKYRVLVQNANSIILRMDPAGTITFFNEYAQKFFGYTESEVLGENVVGTIVPHRSSEGRDLRAMIDEIAIAPEKYATNENENIRRNGERVWIAWTNKPIVDDSGNVIETLCIGNDVTERRMAEQEIRRLNEGLERRVKERTVQYETTNQELESFSYSVSHDLRAPLRAIDGYTRILLGEHRDTLTPDSVDYLTKVRMNTLAMASLIDALLNFSRTGRQSLVKTLVFPADIVKDALDTLRPEQEGRSIEIRIRDLPSCQADPTMLRQVFQNLLSNALKFTRSRAHTVIEVGAIQSDHRTVYYVRDNGVGFDMAYLNKIFGVFQRLHSREYEGTGVGLAIVQRIVKRHGGSIWAESEVDKGSTFYFALEGESVETKENRKTD